MRPFQAVVVRIGIVEQGKARVVLPVELARIGDDTADARAMPSQPFGERVDDDVRTMLDGTQKVRRGEGRIHDERQAMLVRHFGHGSHVGEIQHWIADGFDEDGAGLGGNGLLEVFGIARVHKAGGDSKLRQDGVELGIGATVQVVGRDDFVASLGNGNNGVEDGRCARGQGHRGRAPFKLCDSLLKNVRGGVH